MLADRVERAAVPPREQDVPLVCVLVDAIHGCLDPVRRPRAGNTGEARGLAANRLLAVRDHRCARRDRRPAGVAAEVHVDVTRAEVAVLEEADQVAPVLVHGVDVDVLAADLRVERIRHPGRAVHGCLDAVRELLPAVRPRSRTAAGCRRRGGDHNDERRSGHDPNQSRPHASRVPPFRAAVRPRAAGRRRAATGRAR